MNRRSIVGAMIVMILSAGCSEEKEQSFAGSGIIEATVIMVSAETKGRILLRAVEEGGTVEKESVIAEIDVEDLLLQRNFTATDLEDIAWSKTVLEKELITAQEKVTEAGIALDIAEKTFGRVQSLFDQRTATRDQFDRTETERALAMSRVRSSEKQVAVIEARIGSFEAKQKKVEAQLSLFDSRIADRQVISPTTGTVIETFVEKGEVVNVGAPVCMIADLSSVWLKIYVGEDMLGKITIGGPADIRIDSLPDRTFGGKISWISPRAEFTPKNIQTRESRVDLVYAAKITIDNPEGVFKIGMPADVYIEGF